MEVPNRFYIEVRNVGESTPEFIAFDNGYPYLRKGVMEFMSREQMDSEFESVKKYIDKYEEVSDGSLLINHHVRYITNLCLNKRHTMTELIGYEVTQFGDGIKSRKVRDLTFETVEGVGANNRDKTMGRIIRETLYPV